MIKSQYFWAEDNQGLRIEGRVEQSDHAQPSPYIRIPMATSQWKVQTLEAGYIEVSILAHMDPGGLVPKWITNQAIAKGPYFSLLKMRRLLESQTSPSN